MHSITRALKICDLLQVYAPKSGGIKTYIEAKRKFLQARSGWSHVLIIPGATDQILRDGPFTTYQIAAPLIPNCEPYRFILNIGKVFSILQAERPDVIELANAYLQPWLLFHKNFHPAAVIGFYHTDFPESYVRAPIASMTNDRWAKKIESYATGYTRLIYSKLDGTLVASPQLRQKLVAYQISNLKYVSLGVDSDLFHPMKRNEQLRRKFLTAENGILLLYAGRFDSEKRVDILWEAIQKLPHHYSLVMAGNGPFRHKLVTKSQGAKNIYIVPYQEDREKLAELHASADIYVTAGPYETFGLGVIEAQASGLPVVGVKAGALIERVPESLGLLGTVDSVEEMTWNIQTLANNGYKDKGKAARTWVEKHFSWEKVFQNIFNYYLELRFNKRPLA
ncbi:glycosyltransferase [candidate division KSB1 bacterium]|nr:glycosyltransferase [candidate division KSB1 bacterium]